MWAVTIGYFVLSNQRTYLFVHCISGGLGFFGAVYGQRQHLKQILKSQPGCLSCYKSLEEL